MLENAKDHQARGLEELEIERIIEIAFRMDFVLKLPPGYYFLVNIEA